MFNFLRSLFTAPDISIEGDIPKALQDSRWWFLIKAGVSIFLMWWILRGTNFGEIVQAVRSASVPHIVGGLSLPILGYYLSVSRWRILLMAQGIAARLAYLFRSFLISVFFNNFLPSTIGGDVYRVYESWRLGARKASAFAVIFVDRLLGLFALLVLSMVGLMTANPFASTIPYLSFWILGGFIGMVTLGAFLFHSSFSIELTGIEGQSKFGQLGRELLAKLANGFEAFRGKTATLAKAFGLSLLLQGNVVLQYFVFAEALHFPLSFLSFLLIIPLALFVMLLPVSINGIGIREGIFVLLLSPMGIDKPEALALAWLVYGSYVIHGLLGGLLYATRK